MHTDGLVRVLYGHDLEISGVKVRIYECSKPPTNEYGEPDANALFTQTFHTDSAEKNVFYEAYKSGSKNPFYIGETPPTNDELAFQLANSDAGVDIPIELIIWVVIGSIFFYLFF